MEILDGMQFIKPGRTWALRPWSPRGAAGTAAVSSAVLLVTSCGGSGTSHFVQTDGPGFRILVPAGWTRDERPPPSVGLALLTRGRSTHEGCPRPLLLVREQAPIRASAARADQALGQAVRLYNRFEQIRRPGRRIIEQKKMPVPTTRAAVLIVATYPAGEEAGSSRAGPPVRSFDLLAISKSMRPLHVFASGCADDLPQDFLNKAVLTLRST